MSTQMLDQKYFTIVLHIHRTGGTTLDQIWNHKFGNSILKRQTRKLLDKWKNLSFKEYLKSRTFQDKFYTSHVCYGVHELLPQPSTYITFVREPVSRIISLYYYSKSTPGAYYHGSAQNKTLEEFALETKLHELDNGQVRIIAGGSKDYFMNRTPYGKCDQSLLEIAKKNIEKDFAFVGVTDLFDESLFLLCEACSWEFPLYFHVNQSSGNKSLISEETKQKIAEINHLDTQLYQFCRNQVLDRLKKSPSYSPDTLAYYQDRNQRYNERFGSTYRTFQKWKSQLRNQLQLWLRRK
jgi:hypothetical protein